MNLDNVLEVGNEVILISYSKAKEIFGNMEWVEDFEKDNGWGKKVKIEQKVSSGKYKIKNGEFEYCLNNLCFETESAAKLNRLQKIGI